MDATIRTMKQFDEISAQLKQHAKCQREDAGKLEAKADAFREAAEMLRNNCHRDLEDRDCAKVANSGSSQPMSEKRGY